MIRKDKLKYKIIVYFHFMLIILLSVNTINAVELDENMTNTDTNSDVLALDISNENSSNLNYYDNSVSSKLLISNDTPVNETPSISIETFISNKDIYIGNSTEVIVTVKNIGNCSINNLSIEAVCYSLCYSNFQSINGFWNLNHNKTFELHPFISFVKTNETRNVGHSLWFDLRNTLEVNESCSLKIVYNATKKYYYSYPFMDFNVLCNDTILNSTSADIEVYKIPANVYINRKIKNNSLILDVNVSTSDNSVFSGQLSISLAKNYNPFETFDSYRINIVNNTGHASIKLPLPFDVNYGVWNPTEEEISNYSYNYIYDSFDENLVQSFLRANDLVKIYKNNSQFVVDARTEFCDNITFEINGVTYVRNVDESGFAKLNINLPSGDGKDATYRITATNEVTSENCANKIKVLTILEAKDLKISSKDSLDKRKFAVKLLNGQGQPLSGQTISININGVIYNKVTDSNGFAYLNINLPPNTYIATASYNGLNIARNIIVTP